VHVEKGDADDGGKGVGEEKLLPLSKSERDSLCNTSADLVSETSMSMIHDDDGERIVEDVRLLTCLTEDPRALYVES
jgi:hypothetical protein